MYAPHKVRRVEIPKEYGNGIRPIGIPTMEDRMIQQCIKQVLEPICEAKFHNHLWVQTKPKLRKRPCEICVFSE